MLWQANGLVSAPTSCRGGRPSRAACCCLVERQYGAGWPERVGEAINILKAVSSYCNQPLSTANWLARSFNLHAHHHCAATPTSLPTRCRNKSPTRRAVHPAAQSLDPITTYWSPPVIRPIILSPLRWPQGLESPKLTIRSIMSRITRAPILRQQQVKFIG